jgi:hypothetical protein
LHAAATHILSCLTAALSRELAIACVLANVLLMPLALLQRTLPATGRGAVERVERAPEKAAGYGCHGGEK